MTTLQRGTCLGAAALALALIGGFQPAQAACGAPFLITTVDPESGAYTYVVTPGADPGDGGSSITDNFSGAFWGIGVGDPLAGVGNDNGTFPALAWANLYAGYPATLLTTWAASLDIDGCIDAQGPFGGRCQATLLTDINPLTGEGVFAFITTPERPDTGDIIMLNDGDFALAPAPGLNVVGDPVLGDTGLSFDVEVPSLDALSASLYLDATAGCDTPLARALGPAGLVQGAQVRVAAVPAGSPAPAANDLGAWTPVGQVTPLGGSASFIAECTSGSVYVAYTLLFDSGFQTDTVLGATGANACGNCGNGVVDSGEQCDDGNTDPGDGCDEMCQIEECADDDGDGFGDPGSVVCTGGTEDDCDDNDPSTFPGADELCDGLDNDCDGVVPADEADADGDGFRVCDGDCDDNDPDSYPGAPELCDGLDNDCDGTVPGDEIDDDGDNFAECEGDCADDDASRFPGAPEVCNGIDDDCDGAVPADETDDDGDGVAECEGDCNDADATVRPDIPEVCANDVDNDCDGLIGLDDEECDPLLVELESFTATVTPEGVVLKWKTASEVDNVGFQLLRAQVRGAEKVTREMKAVSGVIFSQGTAFSGAEYTFTDGSRQAPGVVLYYLQDIDSNGRRNLHGPVQVNVGQGRGGNRPR